MTPPTWLDAGGRRRPTRARWTCGRLRWTGAGPVGSPAGRVRALRKREFSDRLIPAFLYRQHLARLPRSEGGIQRPARRAAKCKRGRTLAAELHARQIFGAAPGALHHVASGAPRLALLRRGVNCRGRGWLQRLHAATATFRCRLQRGVHVVRERRAAGAVRQALGEVPSHTRIRSSLQVKSRDQHVGGDGGTVPRHYYTAARFQPGRRHVGHEHQVSPRMVSSRVVRFQ
jgi:hypothetical protein